MSYDLWLEIRKIPDDTETLRALVTDAEWETAAAMKPAARRAEWLTWRAVARERLGRETAISYDVNNAPVLEEGSGCIGVSHTKGWVAVMWSPRRCAVDVEHTSRDVSRTSPRFISEEENELADAANPLFPISVWCAKEALYKYSGIRGLDFLADIRIVRSDLGAEYMEGSVKGGDPMFIKLFFRGGLVCAVVT